MKASEVTRLQFAQWSFERDRLLNMYPRRMPWTELPEDEKVVYLEEADYYLKGVVADWPVDILKRLDA